MKVAAPSRHGRGRALALLATVLCAGCAFTTTWEVPLGTFALPHGEPLALRVRLYLTDEFRAAEWRARVDPFAIAVMPVGDALADGAKQVARAAFTPVEVAERPPLFPAPDVDAILVPRVVSIDRTNPPTIFGEQETSIVLEWTLRSGTGEPLWVGTFTGRGKGRKSAHPDKTARTQMQAAMREVFGESFVTLSSSPAIRRLVRPYR